MSKFWKSGDPFVWWTGGALALSLIMVTGLVLLILINGLGFFWAKPVDRYESVEGAAFFGEVAQHVPVHGKTVMQTQVKVGNRDFGPGGATQPDFLWIDDDRIKSRETPAHVMVLERREWGNFYGVPKELRENGKAVASGHEETAKAFHSRLGAAQDLWDEIRAVEKDNIGHVNHEQEAIRLRLKKLEMAGTKTGPEVDRLNAELAEWQRKFGELQARIAELRKKQTETLVLTAADGRDKEILLSQIVRGFEPNSMGFFSKIGLYVSRFLEFIFDGPREANTEGGVFPAIFGTVMMVFLMSLVVTPLGVIAALYLREYAKQGPLVSAVRIAVNNLAGVPSIVFGVFGVGFFIYFVGGTVDKVFFSESLPSPTLGTGGILWASLTLALLTVPVVIVSTEEGLAAIPRALREGSLALGATKWETTWRVVLPALTPSILTGIILAMARAAGEVAPLMITGVVKLAEEPPLDGYFPFLHLDRKFMHLGFHIYDVGFQSPNVDAARPMVFMTTVLLIVIIVALNLTAIIMRKRLKTRYALSSI